MTYKLIVTSEYEVTEEELNRLYDLIENTKQRVFLVNDIFGSYHIYDTVYVKNINWNEVDRVAPARPSYLPEQERVR